MKSEQFRIGSPQLVNGSHLYQLSGFDVIFKRNYEFVYIADFYPLLQENGTWQGALGYLQKDIQMGSKLLLFTGYHL